jgi:hypothetical protein
LALAPVDPPIVDAPANPLLEHPISYLNRKKVVFGRKPGSDSFGEYCKCALDRRVGDDDGANGRVLRRQVCSFYVSLLFDRVLIRSQSFLPESIEICAEGVDAVDVDSIHAPVASTMTEHETGPLQNLEVLRDSWPANRQIARDFSHSARTIGKSFEDRSSARISQCSPDLSNHPSMGASLKHGSRVRRGTVVLHKRRWMAPQSSKPTARQSHGIGCRIGRFAD